jgi:hypothetical protein
MFRGGKVELRKERLFLGACDFPTGRKFKSWELVKDGNLHTSILNMEVECSSEMSVSVHKTTGS